MTPSSWRERPGRYQLEAPNQVHFHPPGGLRIPAAGAGVDIAAGGVDGGSPLLAVLDVTGAAWVQPLVRVGAVTASLGALLALLAGVSRTTLAMARERDLPERLAQIEQRHSVPRTAQVVIGLVVMSLVALVDLRGAIGFSSFGVLVYYAVANLSALRQPPEDRYWPRLLGAVGLVGCVTLAAMLPLASVLSRLCVLLAGCLYRLVVARRQGGGEAHTAQRYPET
nr:amino acid permease [Knoellia sp. DB2414S]